METHLLPNVRGNVQTLRNMWSEKVQEGQKLLKPKPVICRSNSPLTPKQSIKDKEQRSISVDETIINKPSKVTFEDEKPLNVQPLIQLPSVDDTDDFLPLPPPPSSIIFKEQAQSIVTLKQTVAKMFDNDRKKVRYPNVKNNGIRHWHIARHVFRSGLIFAPSRRASDSIIPLLMKTHIAQYRTRHDSVDSALNETPFESLIDYLTYNNDNNTENMNLSAKIAVKRTISDSSACIQRNKLNDTIVQYETIMRHLKNYDKFMETHPIPPSPALSTRKSSDVQSIEQNLQPKPSIKTRQTQSLARSVGRTFTEFVMNDLLLSPSAKTSTTELGRSSIAHAASQTDLTELVQKEDSIPSEEAKSVLNELDMAIENIEKEVQLTPNSEINVIVVNTPVVQEENIIPKEKPLMQRLFEGKKTAYTPNDLHMESTRIPGELMNTYEIAKKKCFFPTERLIYATRMMKVDRRGYKQHVRILCITNERVYIITKKDPYPKEAVPFKDILGVSCTPCKDGFVCIHTRETRDDRGDWLFILDHPCEFITQLFMAMGRNHNTDHFLKIKPKFKHTRRNIATLTDEGSIETRPSDIFRVQFEDYEVLVIYTP